MNIRITPGVYASLPWALREELRRSIPVDVAVLGRVVADAAARVRALGYPELASRLAEILDTPAEKAAGE